VTNNFIVEYGVRVPIASSKIFIVDYDVRSIVTIALSTGGAFSSAFDSSFDSSATGGSSDGFTIDYDTQIVGNTTISKSFDVKYHTLVISTSGDIIITIPLRPDAVPPQIITTSF
jgi:hypothetical protein